MKKLIAALLFALASASPALAAPCGPIPALPDTVRRTEYTGIVAQTGPFSVNFQLYGDQTDYGAWLSVWVNGVAKVPVTDFIVTSPSGALGSLCLPITDAQVTFVVPQTGTIEIEGGQRPRRLSEFSENAGVTAHALNQVFNTMTAQLRERWDRESRLLRTPPGDSVTVLPLASARAGGFLGFDGAGNPLIVATSPSIPILSPQAANTVLAGPTSAGPTVPTFRALVTADVPQSIGGLGGSQAAATANQVPVFPGSGGGAVPTSLTAPLISYTSSGTGAVSRTVKSRLNDIYSALDFGAVADGSTDNTTAFQNLVNAACGNIALIPGNNYVMSGTVTITCPITLLGTLFDSVATGSSANVTATTTTADMFRVNARDVTIRGLFLGRQGTPTTGKGIAVGTDGISASCSISNGSGSLSCTTSVFTSGMAARATRVRVNGAGAGGVPLFATITAFTSGTQVTVSPTASTLVTNSPTLIADVYTDIRIEGNAIYNQNIGVHFINAARQHLIDNFILASGTSTAQAVLWEDQVSVDFGDGFMSNNTLNSQDNTLGAAFHMTSGGSPKATGNKFLGGKYGVFIDFSIGTTGGPIFSGSNSIETCATSAIFMTAAANIQGSNFTGVHTTCGSPNVQVDNAASAVIRDAVFNAFTIAGGGGTAFDMGKCTNCVITANNIDNGAVNPAINIRSNAANNLVSSNNIIGASVTIANASTTTTIDDAIGMGFANLPTSAANGSRIFVSNGTTATSPCTGAGAGSTAFRQNGAWKCF